MDRITVSPEDGRPCQDRNFCVDTELFPPTDDRIETGVGSLRSVLNIADMPMSLEHKILEGNFQCCRQPVVENTEGARFGCRVDDKAMLGHR